MAKINSQAYWSSRIGNIFDSIDKKDKAFVAKLDKELKRVTREINNKINQFYSEYAKDNDMTYAEAQLKVKAEDLSDYVENARKYRTKEDTSQEALNRLNAQYISSKMTRLELLKAEIDFLMIQYANESEQSFSDYLKKMALDVYREVGKGLISSTFNKNAVEFIISYQWSGANFSSRIWNNRDKLVNTLQEELTNGFINGSNPKVVARNLRNKIDATKANSERLVRTESTFVANRSILQRYKDAGIKKYEFVAHIDERTSKVCNDLNKKIFDIDDYQEGVNAPPMHANCRSRVVPAEEELNKFDKYL
ncbi:minor capsid protein [Carnobacterium maltaromaticum]|uniref:minor capsid protein n=1 Tax=Carnobacterium maltaromaticum TaxID=2751 RepID=UPI0039AF60A0